MKKKIMLILGALASVLLVTAPTAEAVSTVPSVSVTAPATVQAGTPITFTVVASTGSPTCKITYTNPRTHSTINVANASAFTVVGDDWTYTPSLGEVGRTEVTTCSVFVPAYPGSRLGQTYSGYAYFSVQANPVAAPLASAYVWASYINVFGPTGLWVGARFTLHETPIYGQNGATTYKRGVITCNNGGSYYSAWYSAYIVFTMTCPYGYQATSAGTQSMG